MNADMSRQTKETSDTPVVKRFFSYLTGYKKYFIIAILGMLGIRLLMRS